MKNLYLIPIVISTLLAYGLTPPIRVYKEIQNRVICDSLKMERQTLDCISQGMEKKRCADIAKFEHCKKQKVVVYCKNNEEIKFVPCSEATKKSDIKLCND